MKEKTKIIEDVLKKVEHPVFKKDLFSLGMFTSFEVHPKDPERFRLLLKIPETEKRIQIQIEANIRSFLKKENFQDKIVISFEIDKNFKAELPSNRIPNVKNLIAVGSGKGGVGKSTVSANLAVSLARAGYKTGLIDADIYGPSLGRMFGINTRTALSGDSANENQINPLNIHGIKLISFSFLLNPDQAVVWRGPMLGKAIEQFLFQVSWGELDYLILDLPPGTGDVQMSMSQLTKVDGAIIVTTPQNVALQDARRAAYMFLGVKIPILGVIENMAAYTCSNCGHVSHIFSKNGAENFAVDLKVPILGQLPLDENIMMASEEGTPIVLSESGGEVAKTYKEIISNLNKSLEKIR